MPKSLAKKPGRDGSTRSTLEEDGIVESRLIGLEFPSGMSRCALLPRYFLRTPPSISNAPEILFFPDSNRGIRSPKGFWLEFPKTYLAFIAQILLHLVEHVVYIRQVGIGAQDALQDLDSVLVVLLATADVGNVVNG